MIAFSFSVLLALTTSARAYWLMGVDTVAVGRMDPLMTPGRVAGHVHTFVGSSNIGVEVPSSEYLREANCTSSNIAEDKSAYWFPQLYFHGADGSYESVNGGHVIYYLFDGPGTTKSFPDDFRMITGNSVTAPEMGSPAQKAVSFLCLNFKGQSTRHDTLPTGRCPDGIRAQINFQKCWNGKDTTSPNFSTHVAYPLDGPEGTKCPDGFPVIIPRVFHERYYATQDFDNKRDQAMNPDQPFEFSNGDTTGRRYHGDFIMGWKPEVLQRLVDECNCNIYGDPKCCADKGLMTLLQGKQTCTITPQIDEQVLGKLPKLPGNNPVRPTGEDLPETNPPKLRCDVQVNYQQTTKRDEHPFGARDHLRFAKRYGGAGL